MSEDHPNYHTLLSINNDILDLINDDVIIKDIAEKNA